MINRVTLIGNLGRDPEVRRLENGSVVAKFSVATNENYKDKSGEWQKQTEWHDVVVWRQLAERAEQQLTKGKLVFVEGKLTHRKWQDKEGNDRYTTEVVANTFRLLERREGGSDYNNNSSFPTEANAPAATTSASTNPAPVQEKTNTADGKAGEDDLPF